MKFKNILDKENTLYFGHIEPGHKINLLVEKGFRDHLVTEKLTEFPMYFWGPEKYGLHQSKLFKSFALSEQEVVLKNLSEMNLSLSWYIERAAYTHGAKMLLLSKTQEEKLYYSQFTYEEALHQKEFENMMDFVPSKETHKHPLIDTLAESIQSENLETSTFMVQVILEGYGMYFYKSLMESTFHPELKKVYRRILKDEADHHGAGLILTQGKEISLESRAEILKYLSRFINALQSSGILVQSIEKITGKLSKEIKGKLLEEINFNENLKKRIEILKFLIKRIDKWNLLEELESAKAFQVKA